MTSRNEWARWAQAHAPTIEELSALADEAYRSMPDEFLKLTGDLVIRVEDFPDEETLEEMGCESDYDLLGLFRGVGLAHASVSTPEREPNMVFIYRRPLLDYWAEYEETLGNLVAHVLIHEIGHHFGLSDDDMERIEAEADLDPDQERRLQ